MGTLAALPTGIKPALPWTGTFTRDKFSDEAALIDREWARVVSLPLYVPAEKIARYNTVMTAARGLLNRVGDSRHPAALAMTTLIQKIDASLKMAGATTATKTVTPTVKPVVTNGKIPYAVSKCTAKAPATPYRADGGKWVCSADMSGPMANKWRWVWELNNRVVYDPFSSITSGPTVSVPPGGQLPPGAIVVTGPVLTDPKLKPADPQCFAAPCPQYVWSTSAKKWVEGSATVTTTTAAIPPPVPGLPPSGEVFPGVPTDGGFSIAGFDLGKFLKPPYLYVLIGVGAWMLLKK
jgi:hypothetical protein